MRFRGVRITIVLLALLTVGHGYASSSQIALDLRVGPGTVEIDRGGRSSCTVKLIVRGMPYNGRLPLTITGLPDGVTAKIDPSKVDSANPTATILLAAQASTLRGNFTVTINGVDGGLHASTSFALKVK